MRVLGTDLYMTRGDSEAISVTVSGYDIQPGDFLEMTVRKRYGSPPVLYRKLESFEDNKVLISIAPKDTSSLTVGEYVYDLQLTFSGTVKTIVKPSKFVLENEVTYGNTD